MRYTVTVVNGKSGSYTFGCDDFKTMQNVARAAAYALGGFEAHRDAQRLAEDMKKPECKAASFEPASREWAISIRKYPGAAVQAPCSICGGSPSLIDSNPY